MMLIFAAAVVLILLGWRRYYRNNWYRGLNMELHFGEGHVYAGNKVLLTETLENRKKLPLPFLEAAFRIPKGIWFADTENLIISDYNYKRDIFSLRGMESITRRYELECQKRGRYRISQVKAEAVSVLFRHRHILEMDISDELYVYPARINVSSLVRLCDSMLGAAESRSTYLEDPFAFLSIRDYTTRDPMKNINWKASARTGSLMVNTFSSVQAEQFMVFLDVEDRNILKNEQAVEEGISIAASLCERLIRAGLPAGLMINTSPCQVFAPNRGRGCLQEIEQYLTRDFSSGKTTDFVKMVLSHLSGGGGEKETRSYRRNKKSAGSTDEICILVSKNNAEEDVRALQAGMEKNRPWIWVVPDGRGGRYQVIKKEGIV